MEEKQDIYGLQEVRKVPFNGLDTLAMVSFIFPMMMLANEGLVTSLEAAIIKGLVYGLALSFLPFYVRALRPKLMNSALARAIVPEVRNHQGVSPLGLMEALFSYVGALALILTIYFFAQGIEGPKPLTQKELDYRVNEEVEREFLYSQIQVLATAREVSAAEAGDAEVSSFEDIDANLKEAAMAKREQLAREISEKITTERQADYVERQKRSYQAAFAGLGFGTVLVFLSMVFGNLRNRLSPPKRKR